MAYKISGNTDEDARVIVINESDWSIESNEEYTAGSYEVGTLASGTKTVVAINSSEESKGYGKVEPAFYFAYPQAFGLNIKEKYYRPGYGINLTVSLNDQGELYQTLQGYGWGIVFISVPKSFLDGRKVYFDMSHGQTNSYNRPTTIEVLDNRYYAVYGDYTYFPDPATRLKYNLFGAEVLHTYSINTGSYTNNIYDTGVLDLSAAQYDDVTIMVSIEEWNATTVYHTIHEMKILESDDTLVSSLTTNQTLTYANIAYPDSPGEVGTYGNPDIFYA